MNAHIYSWNINGLRAIHKNGFVDWLNTLQNAIVGLQETRLEPSQIPDSLQDLDGWYLRVQSAERKGYSGVGVFSQFEPCEVETTLGRPEFDVEGRTMRLRFGELDVWTVYFPNGNGKDRDLSRIPYKLDFYAHLLERLSAQIEEGRKIIVMGDFNTAHHEIDLARPKDNVKTSGFRPEEREAFGAWIDAGFVDTFRAKHQDVEGRYSWWSQRFGVRERNVGWRIDYVLASPAAYAHVVEAEIHSDVMGSDHCPVSVEVEWDIFGKDWRYRPGS